MLDHYVDGYDNVTYGAATSLRENGQVDFNFRMHDDFLKDFWRVRVDAVSNNYKSGELNGVKLK